MHRVAGWMHRVAGWVHRAAGLDGLEGYAHEDEVGLCPVRQRGRGARLHTHGVHVGGGAAARVEGAEGIGAHFEREDAARRQQRCELEREEACARESVSRLVLTYYSRLVLGSCLQLAYLVTCARADVDDDSGGNELE